MIVIDFLKGLFAGIFVLVILFFLLDYTCGPYKPTKCVVVDKIYHKPLIKIPYMKAKNFEIKIKTENRLLFDTFYTREYWSKIPIGQNRVAYVYHGWLTGWKY